MSILKKGMAILLAVVMAMTLAVPMLTEAAQTSTLTVTKAKVGEKYELYRIFDVTYSGDPGTANSSGYSYTLNPKYQDILNRLIPDKTPYKNQTGEDTYTLTSEGAYKYISEIPEGDPIRVFAVQLAEAINDDPNVKSDLEANVVANGTTPGEKQYALNADDTIQITNVPYGYYLMVPSGSEAMSIILSLNTVTGTTIENKSQYPTITKRVHGPEDDDTMYSSSTFAGIGEMVDFSLATRVPKTNGYRTYKMVIEDTIENMEINQETGSIRVGPIEIKKADLNEDGSFSKTQEVKIGEGEGAVTRTYSLTGKIEITSQTTGSGADEQFIQNMKITLNDVSSFPENTQININYSAKVKRTAKIGVSGNQNTAKVTYSSNPLNLSETKTSTEVHTKTYCLELDLIKVVSETGAPLTGSQWRVYELDKKTATYSILVADTSVSTSNQDKPQISITDNQFFIKGLGTGAYQLVETVAPNGYSPIKTPIEFSVLIPDDTEEVTYNNSFANLTPKWVSNSAVRTFDTTKLTSEGKVQITINNGTNPPLPSTGGAGLYIVAGVAIVALLGFGGTAMIKRKVNGGE